MCTWMLDFIFESSNVEHLSHTRMGAFSLCVLCTNGGVSHRDAVCTCKFSNDTSIEYLIRHSRKSEYREEVGRMMIECAVNNMELGVSKMKEMVVSLGKRRHQWLF